MHCAEADYRNTAFVEDAMLEIHQFDITAIPARKFLPSFVASEFVLFPVRRTNVCWESLGSVAVVPEWFIEEQLR
jgi:hypothetical protein